MQPSGETTSASRPAALPTAPREEEEEAGTELLPWPKVAAIRIATCAANYHYLRIRPLHGARATTGDDDDDDDTGSPSRAALRLFSVLPADGTGSEIATVGGGAMAVGGVGPGGGASTTSLGAVEGGIARRLRFHLLWLPY